MQYTCTYTYTHTLLAKAGRVCLAAGNLAAGQNPGRSPQLDSLDGGRGLVLLVAPAPVAEFEFAAASLVPGVLARQGQVKLGACGCHPDPLWSPADGLANHSSSSKCWRRNWRSHRLCRRRWSRHWSSHRCCCSRWWRSWRRHRWRRLCPGPPQPVLAQGGQAP